MKKFVGAICSGVAGVFTFILLSLNWVSYKDGDSFNAWNIMEKFEEIEGFSLFKFANIVLIILAILLILSAVVIVLQNLNVIKLKFDFNKLNTILLTIFAVSIVLMLVASFIMVADMSFTETIMGMKITVKANVDFGAWLTVITGISTCVLAWIFGRKSKQE